MCACQAFLFFHCWAFYFTNDAMDMVHPTQWGSCSNYEQMEAIDRKHGKCVSALSIRQCATGSAVTQPPVLTERSRTVMD